MKIINLKKGKPKDAIYGGRSNKPNERPSPFGNPWPLNEDKSNRDEVCDLFDVFFREKVKEKDPFITLALRSLKEDDTLACFCVPERCHLMTVVDVWEKEFQDWIPPRTLYYAGIGSRETLPDIMLKMTAIAKRLAALGFVLRSGGAKGADQAFEDGAGEHADIYLPHNGFRNKYTYNHPKYRLIREDVFGIAITIAAYIHPAFGFLDNRSQLLIARNGCQILGDDLVTDLSDFVVCWTPDGCETKRERSRDTGGTGQAIQLADMLGIPVFNLAKEDAILRLESWVKNHPNYKG